MRLVIEVTNDTVNCNRLEPGSHFADNTIIGVVTRVTLDDERQYGLERKMREDEFRSHFDIIWEEMGIQIKKAMSSVFEDV